MQAKAARQAQPLPRKIQRLIRASLLNPYSMSAQPLVAPADYARLVDEYRGWAYTCARKNASAVAAVPLRLYRAPHRNGRPPRKFVETRPVTKELKNKFFHDATLVPILNKAADIEEVIEHPWLVLQREVNKFLNGFTLRELTMLFKQVTGNAYWVVPKTPQGTPLEIWVMPSQYVKIIPDEQYGIAAYEYGTRDPKERYDPDDISHFKYPNPASMFYGMGPLEAMFLSVELNRDFDEMERAVLDNGAIIPAYFKARDIA